MRLSDKLNPLIGLVLMSLAHAEPTADPDELPRIAPTEPAAALAAMQMRPGFRLDLAAHEPMVVDPIAMAFDGPGKMFVVEMRGYSERRDEKLGRIRLLFDDDKDGRFDRSTVFAKDLAWPTGVIAWRGGAFVIASPDILYFGDKDGDGVSDSREVVFTGFGVGAKRLNVQALPNNLKWGPDGRIHGATAGNGGKVGAVDLRGLDFSFDPEKRDLRAENGGGQYGLCFDEWGRKFVCSNSDHIQQVVYPRRYAGLGLAPARVSIAADGPAAEVFRLSPDEPWRVVRTRWRVGGLVGGPVEGGGRVSGYFTAATGICIYRGHAFIADAGSNLVHHKVLRFDGVQAVAERPADEAEVEFLASPDNWFRPVQMMPGPDGALYIADMYREVIEHPWSLPESIKKHLDLNSGDDRGRIYRVVPKEGAMPIPKAAPSALAELLAVESGEVSEAQRVELAAMADHASAQVRFQLCLTLGMLEGDWRMAPLVKILAGAGDDRWVRIAAQKALEGLPKSQVVEAVLDGQLPTESKLLSLAEFVADSEDEHLRDAIEKATWEHQPQARFRVAEIFDRAQSIWENDREALMERVLDAGVAAAPERMAAIRLAASAGGGAIGAKLFDEGRTEPVEVQREFIAALAGGDAGDARAVLELWAQLDPSVRPMAVGWLLEADERAAELLKSVEKREVAASAIDGVQRQRLRESEALGRRARSLFPVASVTRAEVVDRFRPALVMKGDPDKGSAIYLARCSACHRAADRGFAYGPDITSFKAAGKESVLSNFLDPNREVLPGYTAHLIELKDGGTLSGVLVTQDATAVRLRMIGGIERRVLRNEVAKIKDLGLSAMPMGLEAGLSVEDVADLLAFLTR